MNKSCRQSCSPQDKIALILHLESPVLIIRENGFGLIHVLQKRNISRVNYPKFAKLAVFTPHNFTKHDHRYFFYI